MYLNCFNQHTYVSESTKIKRETKHETAQYAKLNEDMRNEKIVLIDKCSILQDYQVKAAAFLEEREKELNLLQQEIATLKSKTETCEEDLIAKDGFISKITREKDEIINTIRKELSEEKSAREKILASYMAAISAKQNIEDDLSPAIGHPEPCKFTIDYIDRFFLIIIGLIHDIHILCILSYLYMILFADRHCLVLASIQYYLNIDNYVVYQI